MTTLIAVIMICSFISGLFWMFAKVSGPFIFKLLARLFSVVQVFGPILYFADKFGIV